MPEPPRQLRRYGNGRIPPTSLVAVGAGHLLWRPAARSWLRMRNAARATGRRLELTGAYRSIEGQEQLAASLPDAGITPGEDPSGWGLAIDVGGPGSAAWVAAQGARFGWAPCLGADGHFTFVADGGA